MAQYDLYRPWTSPWSSLDQLRREMNALFDRRASDTATGAGRGGFPPMNFYETPTTYVLTAEVPGVDPADIHVTLEGSTLAIQGERKNDHEAYRDANVHRSERRAGSFRRAFSMPEGIEADKVEATHKHGVLTLRIPKSPRSNLVKSRFRPVREDVTMANIHALEAREKHELQEENTRPGPVFRPDVDILERRDAYLIYADLPGANDRSVNVRVEQGKLVLEAQLATFPEDTWSALHQEYRLGSYHREFRISEDIDSSGVSAKMKNGVLELLLPKSAERQPRAISVQAG